jgi:hypothetical protein
VQVLVQFENTPKAFANFSPGFEEREPWGYEIPKCDETLKGFVLKANPFRVGTLLCIASRVVASSNPGLKLANAFGVSSN